MLILSDRQFIKTRRDWLCVWSIAITGLLLGACSNSESHKNSTLRIGNGAEPSTLDPHFATSMAEAHILNGLYEGLLAPKGDGSNSIAPAIASEWKRSSDSTRWEFTLRSDAKWSNGDTITSKDFLESYKRLLDPKLAATNAASLYLITNAQAYNEGRLQNFDLVGVKAPAPHTLVITLQSPAPYFLQSLQHWAWRPVHLASIEAHGDIDDISNPWSVQAGFASSGPYQLSSWQRNERIQLDRNPHYWEADKVNIEQLQFFPFENQQTEYRAFQSGQLDITEEIPNELIGRHPEIERSDPALATSHLLLNNESTALSQRALRHALSRSIDRALLIRAIEKSGLPATRFTPAAMPNYRAADFEIEEELEFERPQEPLRFLVSNRESSIALAEAMQEMWQRELGIEVRIQNMEFKSLLARLESGDFDISYLAWHGDYLDPTAFLDMWRSDSHFNRARWKNADYDNLLDQARVASGSIERMEHLAAAETLLGKELPIIPIFWKTENYLVSSKITYWPESLIDLRSYKHVQLKP